MNNNKSKLTTILLTISIILNIFTTSLLYTTNNNNHNKQVQQQKEQFKVTNILYKSTDNFYLDPNEIGVEFSDNSWAVANTLTNQYTFQPSLLGDYDYTFDNLQDFKECIKTYSSIVNNGNY